MSKTISFKERLRKSDAFTLRSTLVFAIPTAIFLFVIFYTTNQRLFHNDPLFYIPVTFLSLFAISSLSKIIGTVILVAELVYISKFLIWICRSLDQRKAKTNLVTEQEIDHIVYSIYHRVRSLLNKDSHLKIEELEKRFERKEKENNERFFALENETVNEKNHFQCTKCKKPFMALPPDHIFNVAMRKKCSVCDMLNMMMYEREKYDCEFCQEPNHMFWHHKDLHTMDEIKRAERMFYESDESD